MNLIFLAIVGATMIVFGLIFTKTDSRSIQ